MYFTLRSFPENSQCEWSDKKQKKESDCRMYILISLHRDIACHWNRNESFRVYAYVVEKETSFVAAFLVFS